MGSSFNVGDAIFTVWNSPRALEALVGNESVKGLPHDVSWLRVSHEIHREIHHVKQINEWASSRQSLGRKPTAEARNTGAPDPLGLRRIDRSGIAC